MKVGIYEPRFLILDVYVCAVYQNQMNLILEEDERQPNVQYQKQMEYNPSHFMEDNYDGKLKVHSANIPVLGASSRSHL
jgi:hypothetical protein